jgi:hypothetical protein
MFSVLPSIVGFTACFFEIFRRLPRQLFSLSGRLVRVLTHLVSRLIGFFFLRAAILGICGPVASRGPD